ncbi:hypothetical protein [Variovorax paradoxus]|uniref:hypothetical protein n=1 Tax=Variovorax paradoxus TaxID=34073 RepID=UPI000699B7F3|nr:hypothetical protein [Variovorax paradoxus]
MAQQHSVRSHLPAKRAIRLIGTALAALLIAACGGGGGGGAGSNGFLPIVSPPPPSPPPPAPAATSFTIGGTVSGLAGTVVLRNNDKDNLELMADGAFVFATSVVGGNPYSVTVAQQPEGQTCAVSAAQGTVASANVSDVRVVCAAQTYAIGGTVSGLAASGTLVLRNNGADELSVTANGGFGFAQALPHGAAFDVTVRTQPAGQLCTLANASGIATAPVTAIAATCVADPASLPPAVPATPSVGYAPKAFLFSWAAVASATYYRLGEDPANSGTFSVLADNLAGTTYALQNLVLTAPPAAYRYALQACNANGCSAWSAPVLPDATLAIGYFKRPTDLVGLSGMGQTRNAVAFTPDGLVMAILDWRADAVHLYANDAGSWRWTQTLVVPGLRPGSASFSGEGTLLAGSQQAGAIPGGQVEVFVRGPQGWTHEQTWSSPAPRTLGDFGASLGISLDGTVAVVSEYGSGGAGNFYVFRKVSGQWSIEQRVDAPSGQSGSLFGAFATISQDGTTIAVGSQYENIGGVADAGAAYVYTKPAGAAAWTLNTRVESTAPLLNAWFGGAVALSGNGEVLLVGASRDSDAGYAVAGALYVYRRVGAGYQLEQRISAPFPRQEGRFGGYGTAVSANGSLIAIASFRDGAASTGVNGDMTPVAGNTTGAVMLYEKPGATWTLKTFVKAPNPDNDDAFGYGLALSGDGKTLAVGATNEDSNATGIGGNQADNSASNVGAVYLY